MEENGSFVTSALLAHLSAYYALVRALHEEGVLPISAVVNRLGDRLDFGQQTEPRESARTAEFSKLIYEGLLTLEKEYSKRRSTSGGSAPLDP